ncbi:MAG: prenyltransferase/squalene oxidase repeat-containing protein [Prosthecobacter sp.]|nr:prenyltransferase/squalene oxidase repeat-containing protein [Prosthecobacter sp.]
MKVRNQPAGQPALMTVVLAVACLGVTAAGEVTKADQEKLRAAITKGLGFVATKGDLWMEEKNCNGCHHLPEMLWSHREAKRRGFVIDSAKVDEWRAWAEPKVKNIAAGLEGVAFMTMAMPEKPLAAAESTKLILAGQQADGSWKPAGQLGTMQKRPTPEAQANSTRIFLLALDRLDPAACEKARAKAATWVGNKDAPASVEGFIYRAHYARRFGKPDEATALRAEILKRQHADGGWGWNVTEKQSDSLATGQILHLLGLYEDKDPAATAATDRAHQWLITTQREDGGWPIDSTLVSKIDRSDPKKANSLKSVNEIYAFWGTAWATIGLLQGVPVVEAKVGAVP